MQSIGEFNLSIRIIYRNFVQIIFRLQVYRKNMIGSSLVGASSIPLPELFGSPKTMDDARDKEFDLRLVISTKQCSIYCTLYK